MNLASESTPTRRNRNTASLVLASRIIEFAHQRDLVLDAGVFSALHAYIGDPECEAAAEVGALLDAGALTESSLHRVAARIAPPDARRQTASVQKGVAESLDTVAERMRAHAHMLDEDVTAVSRIEGLLSDLANVPADAEPASLVESLRAVAGMQRQRLTAQIAASREFEAALQTEQDRISELRREIEELRTQTYKDQLTGLLNRRGLEAKLAALDDGSYSALLIDIDHFKSINDRFGHPVGDTAIRSIGAVIRHCLRDCDHIARYGGEEFAVILPDTPAAAAEIVANRIQRTVAMRRFTDRASGTDIGQITVSVGGTSRFGSEASKEVLQRADDALYGSKRAGRDRVTFTHQKEWKKAS